MLAREQGEHAKARACWGEARRTLLGMQAAGTTAAGGAAGAAGGAGGPKEARAAAERSGVTAATSM